MEPHQRGDMNISGPADHTCFRRFPNCGGETKGAPSMKYVANHPSRVHVQQNLNHWNKDKPGHLDLSVSYDAEATWEVLTTWGDFPGNDMVQQTNFTFEVVFPKPSAAAVLRMRYTSYNKYEIYPANNTDAVFYQCSDIEITDSNITAPAPKTTTPKVGAASCTTPEKWTATTESERQHTKIWYDAAGPLVRWDRMDRATGVMTSYVTNYTITADGILEYAIEHEAESCRQLGADLFYPWAYSGPECTEEKAGEVVCAEHRSGMAWGAKRIANSDKCLPHFLHKQYEHITFEATEVASIDPSIFEIPSFCKQAGVAKISCHPNH